MPSRKIASDNRLQSPLQNPKSKSDVWNLTNKRGLGKVKTSFFAQNKPSQALGEEWIEKDKV